MIIFKTNDTKVIANNIRNVEVYPPVASKTLFDKVAIKEAAIALKVINAIFVEKYFMPKKDEVNAAVIVAQKP